MVRIRKWDEWLYASLSFSTVHLNGQDPIQRFPSSAPLRLYSFRDNIIKNNKTIKLAFVTFFFFA